MGEAFRFLSGLQLDLRMDWKVVCFLLVCCVSLSYQQKIPKIYARYTASTSGCPCWWDLTKTTQCGCCKEGINAMQCGYPKHKYCYKKSALGCPGVPGWKFTLSSKGYPCFDKKERVNDCAWCVRGRYQCSGKKKVMCSTGRLKFCDAVIGDCKHIPHACDVNASCVPNGKFQKAVMYKCQCNKGYTGNGIQCFDSEGNMGVDPNQMVSVSMKVNSDYYLYPHTPDQFPNGALLDNLISEMSNANSSCTTSECEVTYSATNL